MRVCREGFLSYVGNEFGCEQVANEVVKEETWNGCGIVAIRLENDSGKRVLDTLKFVRDIERCTEENRVGAVTARTDEDMSKK